jgi:glycine/D-amino acid oxidase-like deaminating enzyme
MRVAICGAGVIGASTAYYLSARGIDVTVFERAEVAAAASGKSGGFLALDWCDTTPTEALTRLSFELHQDLARTLDADIGYRPVDTLLIDAQASRSSSGRSRAQDDSPSSEWLDGESAVRGYIGTRETTAQVHPRRLTRALIDAARRHGATLRLEALEAVVLDASMQATGVITDQGYHEFDRVVLATGPWIDRVSFSCNGSAIEPTWMPRFWGLKGNSVVLEPELPVPSEAVFVEYRDEAGNALSPEIYPRPDGQVYVCGMADNLPLPEHPESVAPNADACAFLRNLAGRLSSRLVDASVVAEQACYRPIASDAIPVIGEVAAIGGLFVAGGHNCWGILQGPGTGYALSELIAERNCNSLDLTAFSPERARLARTSEVAAGI